MDAKIRCALEYRTESRQVSYWTTRGYTNSRIANSRTRQLTDATGDFACLVFVFFWPFIDVFLRVYLNIYNASDSVSCIMSA